MEITKPRPSWRAGYVYFLKSNQYVKIGFAANPRGRLYQLRSLARRQSLEDNRPWDHRYAIDFTLLAQLPAKAFTEKELHKRFASSRLAKTEWFRFDPPLADYIASIPAMADKPKRRSPSHTCPNCGHNF